jgi:5'-deoxynucleotidase YfbR-like HD superfamily hydrolase
MPENIIGVDQYHAVIFREASHVERVHTIPHYGSYTVGQHCYDMLSLLFVLHDNPSVRLIKAIMFHDLAERWTGDIPAPAKHASNEFHLDIIGLEERIKNSIDIFKDDEMLTKEEQNWLITLDKLELLLWAKDQVAMGNSNAAAVLGGVISFLNHWQMPIRVVEFIKKHKWFRTSDQLPKEMK